MEEVPQQDAAIDESQELFSESLSKPAQDALDVFLADEHAVSYSFYDVIKATCEAAFHEGGDSVETLMLGIETQIEKGILKSPIQTFVTHAVSEAYNGRDGTEVFDTQIATTNLENVLVNLGPQEKVSEVIKGIVQSSPNCRFQDVMGWALSDRVVKILEDHYARLCREYVPQIYETLVRKSPVEYISRFIHQKLVSFSVEGADLCGSWHNPEINLRLLIFSLINAEMPGIQGPFGHYTFDVFRSHFIHALRKAKELALAEISDDPIIKTQFQTRTLIGQFFRISLWDFWLRKIWDEARAEEEFLRIAKKPTDTEACDPPALTEDKDDRRKQIVAGNTARERAHREYRRQNFKPTPSPTRKPRSKKPAPNFSSDPVFIGEYREVSSETASVLYQLHGTRRILAYLYKTGGDVSCIISLERRKMDAANGEKPCEYIRLLKVSFGGDASKKGDSGIKRTLQSAFYGQGHGVSKYMRKFGIVPEEIRGIPCDLARHIRNFSRGV